MAARRHDDGPAVADGDPGQSLSEELRESEQRYRMLFEDMVRGVVYQSSDGQVIDANPAAQRMLGLSLDQMRGRTSADPEWRAIHEDGSAFPGDEHPSMVALRTGREVRDVVMGVFNPQAGSWRWIEIGAVPLSRPGESAPYQVFTTFDDVTERRQAEAALRESEARFRGLFDNTRSGVAIYRAVDDGQDFEFVDFNSAAEQIEQTPRQAVLHRRVTEVFPGIREMGLLEVFRRVWRSGRPEHCPVTIYRDQRIVGWRENYIYRLPAGEVVAVYEDVTERKLAEDNLRESEAGLRAVLDATPFPVAMVDSQDDKIEFWSRSALDLFGHTAPTAAEWYEIAYPDPDYRREVVDRWKPFLEEARRSGRAVNTGEYRITCRDGSVRTCELHVVSLPGRLIVTFNDVTERTLAEAEVRRLNAELEQRVRKRTAQLAAKNDELERFTYTVSHDLKAPLRGIAGYAAELDRKHRDGLSERADFCVTQILTATRNMDHLIEDLMRFTRLDAEAVSTTEVDVSRLVDTILNDRGLIIGEGTIDVTVDIPFTTLPAWERGLAQALANLIDNAITYSREADPPRLRIGGEESAAGWRLSVGDNGVGFDMKYHDRIFGLFNRLVRADEYEGTGIGLAITKKVVEKQGGRVWAEATPGEGATFFVELPRLRE